MIEFRVLGPVEVWAGGRRVDAGQPRQRTVLAVLLADAGRSVTWETLIDRVWGQAPPRGARHSLYSHIARIRRVLEQACDAGQAPAQVVSRSGGYVLEVDPDQVDVHRFRRLVAQARDPDHLDRQRVELLREALTLWRGEPLAGLLGQWATRTRESWRQQYLDAAVAWAQAELRVGNPAAVIGTLSDLAGEHPFVESLAAVLMRALHAAGRPADALEHYTTIRHHLVDELGTDPSTELQAVHQAILRGELDPHPARATAVARVVPAQLPADVPAFTGRDTELAQLDTLLAGTGVSEATGSARTATGMEPTAMVISAVSGTAGVGKTALAVHWAHRVTERFPDGQLYVNLRGFDPGGRVMAPSEAVRGLLEAFGVAPELVPSSLDGQVGLYRSLTAGKRMLVLLDNARDAAQVRPLLPGTATAVVLVTSRDQLTSLVAADAARPLTLDVLSIAEARELLTSRLGVDRVAAEPAAVDQIIAACDRLPLALAITAARAQQTRFPLSTLAAELDSVDSRLDVLDAGDAAGRVREVLSWSYAALTPPAARLLRLLGLHPGPDISIPAAASLAGRPLPEARRLLTELTRASLLVEIATGRYTLHDLLRAYATDLTRSHDPDHARHTAMTRLMDHYTHTAHAAAQFLDPVADPIPVALPPPAPDTSVEHLADDRQATAWLTAEHAALLAILQHAASVGFDTHTWHLAWSLNRFLHRRGTWDDLRAAWQDALRAAQNLGVPVAQAYAHRLLGRVSALHGRDADAQPHLQHAMDLYRQTGDLVGEAHTHNVLIHLYEQRGQPEQALDHARQSLALFHAAGHRHGQARALNSVGWCHILTGDHTKALTLCWQALGLMRQFGDPYGQAAVWDSIGCAHHHLAHHSLASRCFQRSIDLYRGLGDRFYQATILTHLGDTQRAAGDPTGAHTAWRQALNILTEISHPDAYGLRTRLDKLVQPQTAGTSSSRTSNPPDRGGTQTGEQNAGHA